MTPSALRIGAANGQPTVEFRPRVTPAKLLRDPGTVETGTPESLLPVAEALRGNPLGVRSEAAVTACWAMLSKVRTVASVGAMVGGDRSLRIASALALALISLVLEV